MSVLLPQVKQTARRATTEELVISRQVALLHRSEPQIKPPKTKAVGTVKEGTSVKLRRLYKLSVGRERAQVKRRPRGDHAGAAIGIVKEEERLPPPPLEEEEQLTPSDRLLLEVRWTNCTTVRYMVGDYLIDQSAKGEQNQFLYVLRTCRRGLKKQLCGLESMGCSETSKGCDRMLMVSSANLKLGSGALSQCLRYFLRAPIRRLPLDKKEAQEQPLKPLNCCC